MKTVQSLLRHVATRPVIRAARAATTAVLDVCRQSLAFTLSMMLIMGQPFFLSTRAYAQTADPTPPPAPTYSPTLRTDKLDYAPTTTVNLTGAGFKPNEIVTLQVVHIVGENTPDPGDLPWDVQADENGGFLTTWYVPWDAFLDTMLATAYGNESKVLASATFSDGPLSDKIEGWRNTSLDWKGSTNAQQSQWAEGQTIPIRVVIDNAVPGTIYPIKIKYDFAKTTSPTEKVHLFDAFLKYNSTSTSLTSDQLISGTGVAAGTIANTATAIPQDPLTGVPAFSAPQRGNFQVYNAKIVDGSGNLLTSIPDSAWSTENPGNGTSRVITFNIKVDAGQSSVVIGYGTHLASPADWGYDPVTGASNGATGFNGGSGKAYESTNGASDNSFSLSSANGAVIQSFQSITFSGASKPYSLTNTFTLNATASSGLAVTYALAAGGTGAGTSATLVGNVLTIPGVGTRDVIASQGGGTNNNILYAAATPVTATFAITQAPLTITASNDTKTYGQTKTYGAGSTAFTSTALVGSETIGSVTITDTNSGGASHANVSGNPYPLTPSAATGGTFTASNYAITYVAGNLIIGKANATISVTGYNVPYDGNSHTATGSATGVFGEALTVLNLSGTTHTAVGTTTDSWTFTDASGNYNNSNGTVVDTIIESGTVTVVSAPNATYDGATHGATSHTTGVGLDITTAPITYTGRNGTVYLASLTAPTKAGDYTATANYPGDASHTASSGHADYTIFPAPLTITASAQSKAYGATANLGTTAFTTSALVSGDSVTSVTLTSTGSDATAAVGSYDIVPSAAVGTGLGNYNITYANGTLTVNAKALTITANSTHKTYGATVTPAGNEFTTGAGQLVNGDSVTSVTLSSGGYAATATVTGGPYTVTASAAQGTGLGNYTIGYVTGTLTVDAKTLTITANSTSKIYGATITPAGTEFTTGANQLVNGDTVTSVTLVSNGYASTAAVVGSPYAVTPSAAQGTGLANYAIGYVNGTLTVTAKALDITADNRSKTYGDTLTLGTSAFSTSGLTGSDSVTSVTLTSTGAAATASVANSPYAIVPSAAVGSGLSNYSITYHNGTLTVDPRALDITATNQNKIYGNTFTLGTTNFTTGAGQLANSDTVTDVTLTSAGAATTATVTGGPYAIVPSAAVGGSGTDLNNYAITYHNGSFTVNPRTLTITANSPSKTYGTGITPVGTEFTTGANQLVNGDSVTSVSLSSPGYVATASVAGSPYTITVGSAVGSGLSNYAIGYVNGTLTVTAKTLTITANSSSKIYGATVTPAGTEFTTGANQLVNGDTVTSVTLVSNGYASTAAVVGSPYAVTPSAAQGTGLANYAIGYVNGTLTVTAKALDITADNRSKTYGDTLTLGTSAFSTSGLTGSDSVTSVTLSSTGAAAAASVTGSPYAVTPSAAVGSGLSNYSITYHNGTLTVDPRALDITAGDQSKTYGNTHSLGTTNFSTVLGQLVNGDTVTDVTLASTGAAAGATVAGSPYAIVPSAAIGGAGTDLNNYAIHYYNGSLTVNPRTVIVTANSSSKTYGTTITPLGTEFTTGLGQLVNGDTITTVTLASPGFAASATVAGSPYAITPSAAQGTGLANYSISYANGQLTLDKASVSGTLVGVTDVGVNQGTIPGTLNLTSFAGQAVTLRADLTYSGAVPTGTVNFYQFIDATLFATYSAATEAGREAIKATPGTVGTIDFNTGIITPAGAKIINLNASATIASPVNGSGQGALGPLNYPILAVGHHLLAFDYSGDSNYNKYDPVMDWGVVQVPTSTAVVASASPVYGSAITFTATVTSTQPTYANFNPADTTHGFAEGVVTFKDNGTAFGSVTVTPANFATYGQADGTLVVSISRSLPAGTGHTITAEYFDGNPTDPTPGAFGFSSSQVTPNVSKADPTISVTPYNVPYDGNSHTATGSATGTSGESLSGLDLSGTAHTAAGDYTDTWTFTDTTGNYNNKSGTVNDKIGRINASVTPDPKSKVYGATDPTLTGTLSGFLVGDNVTASYSRTAGETVGGSPYTISATLAPTTGVLNNYNITYNTAPFTITKANATINVTPYNVPYDGASHTATGTATGAKGEDLSSLLNFSNTVHTAASTYATDTWSFPGDANHNPAGPTTITDTITRIAASVTPAPKSKVYGATDPVLTGSLSGFLAGDNVTASYSRTAGETVASSPYTISATLAPTTGVLNNYNITYNTAPFTITKADATFNVTPYNVPYDGASHTATGTATGAKGENLSSLLNFSNTVHTAASTYATDTWSFPGDANHNPAGPTTITDTITRIAASVTPAPKSKVYGATDPTLTGSLSGFLAGDNVTASYSRTAGETVASSPYTISATLAPTTGVLNNYNITYNTAPFTITKADATFNVTPYNVPYDGASHTATGTATGAKGENLSSLLNFSNTVHTAASTYATDTWSFPGDANHNPAGPTTITDTITRIAASVTPAPKSKVYGATDPVLTGSLSGFLAGDNVTASYSRTAGETVASSPYTISATLAPTTGVLNNYNITYNTAPFTITKADATFNVTPYNVPYDGASHTATGTATGARGEDLSSLLNFSNTVHTAAGTYATDTWSFPGDANHNPAGPITITDTITRIAASVTPAAKTKVYGDVDPALTGSLSGFLAGDNVTASYSRTAGETVASSPYTISATLAPTTGVLNNYNITYNTANFTITKATLTIKADDATRAHGTANPTFNAYVVSGAQFTDTFTVTASSAATPATPVGVYPGSIIPNAAGSALGNYYVVKQNGTLTIIKGTAGGTMNGETDKGLNTGGISGTLTYASIVGQAVTLRAIVTGTGALPGGTVTFYLCTDNTFNKTTATAIPNVPIVDNVTVAGVPTNGVATVGPLNYPDLTVETHYIAFTYNGDSNYNSFDPDMGWGISQADTSTSVVVTTPTPTYGTPVVFTATVTDSDPYISFNGAGGTVQAAEGTVSFFLDGNSLAFATLPVTVANNGVIAAPGQLLTAGSHQIQAKYSGSTAYKLSSSSTVAFNVAKSPTNLTVSVNASFVADCTGHGGSATATGPNLNITSPDPLIVINYTGRNGTTYNSAIAPRVPGFYTITANYLGDANHLPAGPVSKDFSIIAPAGPGPGGTLYTGSLFFWTTGPSSSTASLALSVTVADILNCQYDIRGATVTFWASNDGISYSKISNAVDLPVGLVVPTDTSVGTASALSQWNMKSNNDVEQFYLGVTIGGVYSLQDPLLPMINGQRMYTYPVTVAKPGIVSSFIGQGTVSNSGLTTAGVPTSTPSATVYPQSSGYLGNATSSASVTDTSFIANVKYNKSGTNPQGKVTVEINSYNKSDGTSDYPTLHHYVATSTAITELTLKASSKPMASFSSKITLKEVLPDGSTVGIDSGNMMNITLVDGAPDLIAIQIQKSSGGLWYASSWGPASPGAVPSTLAKPVSSGGITTF